MLTHHYLHLSRSSPPPIRLHRNSHGPRIRHLRHLKFHGLEIDLRSTGRAMRRRCRPPRSQERVRSEQAQDTRRALVRNLCRTQILLEEAPSRISSTWNRQSASQAETTSSSQYGGNGYATTETCTYGSSPRTAPISYTLTRISKNVTRTSQATDGREAKEEEIGREPITLSKRSRGSAFRTASKGTICPGLKGNGFIL